MSWYILFAASLFEMGWAIGIKYTVGFTKLVPSVLTLISMFISVYLLSIAMHKLPVGTAYAVWTGIGSVGTVILGIVLFGESVSLSRIVCIGLIVSGILGLKMVSS